MTNRAHWLVWAACFVIACDAPAGDVELALGDTAVAASTGAILSAFWGADDAPAPPGSPLTCMGLTGPRDGMPLVLSQEVNQSTMQPTDFQIDLADGITSRSPDCVKLAPANEENEDRTILLIGDFADVDNPPVKVSSPSCCLRTVPMRRAP